MNVQAGQSCDLPEPLTITYGGILFMYCAKISSGFTMAIPLPILEGLAADFDRVTVRIQSDLYTP